MVCIDIRRAGPVIASSSRGAIESAYPPIAAFVFNLWA